MARWLQGGADLFELGGAPAQHCSLNNLHRCRPHAQEEAGLPVQDRVYRSLKLWSLYADLEERWEPRPGQPPYALRQQQRQHEQPLHPRRGAPCCLSAWLASLSPPLFSVQPGHAGGH